jgi:glycerophosphoryl diester phosphodiesterase
VGSGGGRLAGQRSGRHSHRRRRWRDHAERRIDLRRQSEPAPAGARKAEGRRLSAVAGGLTRRELALAATAAGLAAAGLAAAPAFPAFADERQPAIIAAGGAAEERIVDTRSAFELAIQQGADFLQATLVPTKEGALIARRSAELSATTDVASRLEFAGRKVAKTIAGQSVNGWFAEDFTLAEIATLTAREPDPAAHPQNARLNGKEPVLSLPDLLQIARDGCLRTGRTIGACLRLVDPARYADLGLDVVGRLADELNTEGYVAPAAAIWVQAFETDALRAFGRLSRVRRMLMIDAGDTDAAARTTTAGLGEIKAIAEAVGPDQALLIDPAAATFPAPTTLALDAHNAGLAVFAHTARAQNAALPPALRRGANPNGRGDVGKLLVALFSDRVDGVATDLPAEAARARGQVMDALRRAQSRS